MKERLNSVVLMDLVKKSLRNTGFARFKVVSNCMFPLIKRGDWVEVLCLTSERPLAAGDIILFFHTNSLVLHRVVKLADGLVWTKGDRNRVIDPPIHPDDVLGRLFRIKVAKHWLEIDKPFLVTLQRIIRSFFWIFDDGLTVLRKVKIGLINRSYEE
jgi:signal peptidase I